MTNKQLQEYIRYVPNMRVSDIAQIENHQREVDERKRLAEHAKETTCKK